jgi:transcriptional regulator with XRE-family HTH domain
MFDMEVIEMSIGQKIKNIRKANKLTQVELAKKANISRSYLADIENDRYNASVDTLKSIANSLDVKLSELIEESSSDNKINSKNNKNKKQIETIAAHLEDKNLTPKKVELIKNYIDALFDEFDD